MIMRVAIAIFFLIGLASVIFASRSFVLSNVWSMAGVSDSEASPPSIKSFSNQDTNLDQLQILPPTPFQPQIDNTLIGNNTIKSNNGSGTSLEASILTV